MLSVVLWGIFAGSAMCACASRGSREGSPAGGDHRPAPRALQQQAEFLRKLIQNAPAGVAVVDRELRFILANPAYRAITDHPEVPLEGRTVGEVFGAETARIVEPLLRQAFESGQTLYISEHEAPIRGRSWWNVTEVPLRDPAGKVESVIILTEEATQRKRAERLAVAMGRIAQIIHSGQDFDRIMEQVLPEAAEALDCGSAAVSLREEDGWTVRHVYGLSREVIGRRMSDQEEPHAVLSIRQREPVLIEDAFSDPRVNADHMRFWNIRSVLVVPMVAGDRATGVLFFNHQRPNAFDQTHVDFAIKLASSLSLSLQNARLLDRLQAELIERARVQRQLETAMQRLDAHMDNSPLAVIEWGPDMRIIRWSKEAEHIFGWKAEEVLGKGMWDLRWVYEEDADHVRLVSRDLVGGKQRFSSNRNYRKDGSVVECQWYNSTLVDSQGEFRSILSLVLDVTEQQRTQRALQEAKAAAEAASRAKDQFIAVLSHELRTPLTPALAALAMLRCDHRLPADVREDLETVARNIDLEVRLIADLLDVSRVISGKLHLEKRPVDVAIALREAANTVRPDLEARHQTLSIDATDTPYLALADAARLQQVFWNLLRNAIKFSPEHCQIIVRGRVLPIEQWPLAADPCPVGLAECPLGAARPGGSDGSPACGGNLVVEVIDPGCGIAPEVLPRLFNAFEQGQEARSFGGLGLGLSICKAVVETHGGTIAAHSDGPGRGATFTIRLPVARCPLTPAAGPGLAWLAKGQRPAEPGQHATGGQSLRILLVEDHLDTARLMRRLLASQGHRVTAVATVADALEAVGRSRPDLLISDLGLPDGSGLELMQQLARRGDRIPSIALSGYGTAADIEKSRAAGFADHLVKPLSSVEALWSAIERAQRTAASAHEAQRTGKG